MVVYIMQPWKDSPALQIHHPGCVLGQGIGPSGTPYIFDNAPLYHHGFLWVAGRDASVSRSCFVSSHTYLQYYVVLVQLLVPVRIIGVDSVDISVGVDGGRNVFVAHLVLVGAVVALALVLVRGAVVAEDSGGDQEGREEEEEVRGREEIHGRRETRNY